MNKWKKVVATSVVVAVAIAAVGYKYRAYILNPWTRDGQVRAQVIQITPRVSGPVRSAQLDLKFTEVRAPVDGDVTNLRLRLGSQAVANQPALAFVDINSFWIHGFFRESYVAQVRPGDKAVVTLMSYPDTPLNGIVDSIGRGIAQQDGSTGEDLLPNVSPTFEWIRLAQRVPIRVQLTDVPSDIDLIVGTTASVLVMTETAGSDEIAQAPPAPSVLQ